MQGTGIEFEPRLEVDGVGQELITTDVGFVWEPLMENVGFDREPRPGGVGLDFEQLPKAVGFDFEQTLEGVNHAFEPRCVGPRRMFCHRLPNRRSSSSCIHAGLQGAAEASRRAPGAGRRTAFSGLRTSSPRQQRRPPTSRAGLAAKPYRLAGAPERP